MPEGVPTASEQLRERAAAELAVRLPDHLGRLSWDRARLESHQRDRLRDLLGHAAAHSPFHARRLAGIDVGRFEVADLPRLPVMTKSEMMSEFDDVVTDRRLLPVPPGTTADKVLVTNLHNRTQPLIRYELTDRFTRHQDDPDGRPRATVDGRAEYVFRYGDISVHPRTFDTALDGTPEVTDYQVRQTGRGAIIDVVADGRLDRTALETAIRRDLERSGLRAPEILVRVVMSIGRPAESGKVLRFVPAVEAAGAAMPSMPDPSNSCGRS